MRPRALVQNQQTREMIVLDIQGTQQQRHESPVVTLPGVQVKTRYINSQKGRRHGALRLQKPLLGLLATGKFGGQEFYI